MPKSTKAPEGRAFALRAERGHVVNADGSAITPEGAAALARHVREIATLAQAIEHERRFLYELTRLPEGAASPFVVAHGAQLAASNVGTYGDEIAHRTDNLAGILGIEIPEAGDPS